MNLDINIDEVKNDTSFFELYKQSTYDILFIEYDEDIWKNVLNNILLINVRQKIILISDKFSCSQSNDCEQCQKKYNVNILIKPILDIQTSELFVKKFICEEYRKNELQFKLLQLNRQLNLEHALINIDLELMVFKLDSLVGYQQIMALSDLIYELNKMNIKYEVFPNLDVKILNQ